MEDDSITRPVKSARHEMSCKGLFLFFLVFLTVQFHKPLYAVPPAGEYFETESYNVEYRVAENNSFLVREEISLIFSEARHGIFRYIPQSESAVSFFKGTEVKQKLNAVISSVNVEGRTFKVLSENGNIVIRIGDPDAYVSGKQTYKISYRVELSDDGITLFDNFYWNVIPHNWKTPIKKADVRIVMPKDFDTSKCEFIAGRQGGSADTEKARWTAEKKADGLVVLEAQASGLSLGEGITALFWLPEGYFSGQRSIRPFSSVLYAGAILLAVLAFILWYLYGRDPHIVKTVQFYPPEGLGPADIGYILDGRSDDRDFFSLFVYFAHKGFLRIEEVEESRAGKKPGAGKKTFELVRLVDEIPLEQHEKTFFEGIFAGKRNRVSLSDLGYDFSLVITRARSQLHAKYNRKETRIFTKTSLVLRRLFHLLALAPFICTGIVGVLYGGNEGSNLLAGSIGASFAVFLSYLMIRISFDSLLSLPKSTLILRLLVWGIILLAGFTIMGLVVYDLFQDPLLPFCIMGSSFTVFLFLLFMRKRTVYGAELQGAILGFRRFIQSAETDRINWLVEADPSYFFALLPYAYVLGLNSKWIDAFENIQLENPIWYSPGQKSSVFNAAVFDRTMNSFPQSFSRQVAATSPAGSSGGSGYSGGGGSSGGGGGGGGGGSW